MRRYQQTPVAEAMSMQQKALKKRAADSAVLQLTLDAERYLGSRLQLVRALMQFSGAEHLIALDKADNRRTLGERTFGVRSDQPVIGYPVEAVTPALQIESEKMVPKARKIRWPELPYPAHNGWGMMYLILHVVFLLGSSQKSTTLDMPNIVHRNIICKGEAMIACYSGYQTKQTLGDIPKPAGSTLIAGRDFT
jgi:hypothetical protein